MRILRVFWHLLLLDLALIPTEFTVPRASSKSEMAVSAGSDVMQEGSTVMRSVRLSRGRPSTHAEEVSSRNLAPIGPITRAAIKAMLKPLLRRRILLPLLLVTVSGSFFYFCLKDHTTYAPGFSRARFKLISTGISEARVKLFIGSPLDQEIGPFGEVWHYEPQWMPWPYQQQTRGLIVTFGPDGKVADTMGSPQAVAQIKLHSGALASEVLKTAGLPIRVECPYYKKAWYSRQRGKWGRFSLFAVLYDYSGTVVATQAEWDFD